MNALWHALLLTLIYSASAAKREVLIRDQGKIIFYDDTWTLNFHLNLQAYVKNAMLLENSTIALINLCRDLPSESNCQFFIQNLREEAKDAQNDIERIKQFSRSKRWAWGAIFRGIAREALVCFGVIAATEIINENRMNEIKEQLNENRELVMSQLQITKMQNEIIADTSNQVTKLYESVHKLNQSTINTEKLNDLLEVTTIAVNRHTKQTNKFINILNGDLRAQFFSVIDTDSFKSEITAINKKLLPKAKLPASNPQDLLDLSKISSMSNDTHISIVVKIPIITNKTYDFFEYIPIPFKTETTLHILNSNAKYYLQANNNKTKFIPLSALQKCNTVNKRTFCSSIILEELRDINPCMKSILSNAQSCDCTYREILHQNYILRLSVNSVFCYIIKPITIKISCNEKSTIYELDKNTEIDFANQCELHRVSNEFHYDADTFSSVEINYPLTQPNFTIYDPKYEKWSANISIINRNNIKMLKLNNEIEIIESKMELEPKSNETGFFSTIANFGYKTVTFFKDLLTLHSIFYICIYVLPPVVIAILIYKMCYKIRSFSFQK